VRRRRELLAVAWWLALPALSCAKDSGGPTTEFGDGGNASTSSGGGGTSTGGGGTLGGSTSSSSGGGASSSTGGGVGTSSGSGGTGSTSGGGTGPASEGGTGSSGGGGSGSSSGGAGSSGGGPGGASAVDSEINAIIAGIDANRIWQTIQKLAGFGTRNSCSTAMTGGLGITAARDWIKAQYDSIGGLTTSLFPYAQTGCSQSLTNNNVIAVLPGKTHPERVVLVSGHYDSRTLNVSDGTSPAPGANDSGSQSALVLELARVFVGHAFDATLMFASFAGEEQGLVGSKALAQSIATVVPNGQVVAALNSDIVGGDNTVNDATALQQFRLYSPGTPREVGASTADGTPDDTSPSRGVMRYIATWGSAYVPSMAIVPELREDRPGRGSDHEPFIGAGRPGVRFIETHETPNAGTVPSHQHSPNDLAMYVTPAYTARIAQVVASVAASLARAPDSPASIQVAGNSGAPTLTWSVPSTGGVDHYVVAARAVTENFYHARVSVAGPMTTRVTPAALGVDGTQPYFVSVAAVDAKGHESLFAYPEYRCDTGQCVVPPGALNITATR
jgi:Zn-dependent M28 family amino/carboxypeptidase